MKEYYIGIDIGGTSVRIAFWDNEKSKLSPIVKKNFLYFETVDMEIEENIIRNIDRIIIKYKLKNIKGIGISCAALVNRSTGVVNKWPNNEKWSNYPLLKKMEEYYQTKIIIEEDVNAAALGEQIIGKAKKISNYIYISIGTGIGCGVVLNNRLLIGENGEFGELGHIKIDGSQEKCVCGKSGCLQALASGPAIVRRYNELVGIEGKVIELKDIVTKAYKGDIQATKTIEEAGRIVGIVTGNLIKIFDVSNVILGGGVIKCGTIFKRSLEQEVNMIVSQERIKEIKYTSNSDKNGIAGVIYILRNQKTRK